MGWSDLDSNAHMANSSYLDHASDTRMLYFSQNGFAISRFAAEKFGPVVLRDELTYRKELKLMEEFTVDLEAVGLSKDGSRFRIRNTFRNAIGEIAAVVTSDGVWFDLESRKPRPPPEDLDNLMRVVQPTIDYMEIPSRNTVDKDDRSEAGNV